MSRHHDVPVVFDGGVEYLAASLQVKLDRPPKRGGFGRKQERDTYPLGDCDRARGGTRIVTPDDRAEMGVVESWEDEALRLRVELAMSNERVEQLTAQVAKLMVEP